MALWFCWSHPEGWTQAAARRGWAGQAQGVWGVAMCAPTLPGSSCTSSVSREGRHSFTDVLECSPMPRASPEACGPSFCPTQTPPPPASSQQAPRSETTVHRWPACLHRLPLHTVPRGQCRVCLGKERTWGLRARGSQPAWIHARAGPAWLGAWGRRLASVPALTAVGGTQHPSRTEARLDAEHTADNRDRHSVNIC